MSDILTRTFTPEVRAAEGERRVTFVASDSTRDSAGTVLNQQGWDLSRFNRNGVIGYQHKVYGSYEGTDNPDNVIGKGRAYVEGGRLMVDVDFEPADINGLAEKVYRKILFGSLKAVSVGFLPVGDGHWGEGEESRKGASPTWYYDGQELLEVSVVNIPANPNAVRVKGLDSSEEEMRELLSREEPETRETAPETPETPETQPEPEIPDTPETPETPSEGFDPLELQRELTVAEATSLI